MEDEEEKSTVLEDDEIEHVERNEFLGATLNFPKDIPFQYEYEMDKFYVRSCCGGYYDCILEMLTKGGMRSVTVTGTPGIGKSMFMAYFFLRYSLEYKHANPTIILASYNVDA